MYAVDRDRRGAVRARAIRAPASTSISRCSTHRSRAWPTRGWVSWCRGRRRAAVAPLTRTSCLTRRSPRADGHLMLAIGNDRQFAAFCERAGEPALATDDRFATNAQRVEHRKCWSRSSQPVEDAQLASVGRGTPAPACRAGPINDVGAGVCRTAGARTAKLKSRCRTPSASAPGVSNPIRYSRTPIEYDCAPPLLGEHTGSMLAARLGLAEAELARCASGALFVNGR